MNDRRVLQAVVSNGLEVQFIQAVCPFVDCLCLLRSSAFLLLPLDVLRRRRRRRMVMIRFAVLHAVYSGKAPVSVVLLYHINAVPGSKSASTK